MIDVLCTAVLRDGSKLYQHFKTIDYPIKRYFIIDNSCGQDESVLTAINRIHHEQPEHISEIAVLKTVQNTGYPGAVNLAIRQNTDCRHWVFTGFDWYLEEGELECLSAVIDEHPKGMTLGLGDDEMCGIVLTPRLLHAVGYMDENFYPGYFEDNDYRYRQKLAGVQMSPFPLQNTHITSSTLHSSKAFEERNRVTFAKNFEYYIDKWGGPPGRELYETPFDLGYPISYWHYDPQRIESLRWV